MSNSKIDRLKEKSNIKTVTYKKNFPDAAMTKLANMLGKRFINCSKIDGRWVVTYLEDE